MSDFEAIVAFGNRGDHAPKTPNRITCADEFNVSVIAGGGAYCSPRPALCWGGSCPQGPDILASVGCEYPGPYTHVEVGFPSERPEPWSTWEQYAEDMGAPTETVYSYVPVELVRALIESHGGTP